MRRRAKRPAAQASLVPASNLPAGDPQVRVNFELTGLQLAEFEKLMEKLQGQRSKEEVLLLALATLSENGQSPRRASPPVQVVVHRCDVCKRASVPTNRGDRRLPAAEAEAATCDAVEFEPHRRSRSSMPPKLRRQVLARDGHRCRRCSATSHLNVHHRHKQEDGGAHTLQNCETLCRGCHIALHREEELFQRGVTVETIAPG